jgi:hypothetical protein
MASECSQNADHLAQTMSRLADLPEAQATQGGVTLTYRAVSAGPDLIQRKEQFFSESAAPALKPSGRRVLKRSVLNEPGETIPRSPGF